MIQSILKDDDDLCKDFLENLRGEVSNVKAKAKAITDPRVGNNCVYHSHKTDEKCVKKQNKLKRKGFTAGLSN